MINSFILGITLTYLFPVNETVYMNNPFFWPVTSICKVTSDSSSNLVFVKALQKSGSFNGVALSKGQSIEMILYSNSKIEITAMPGAEVELINRGESLINAECIS